MHPDSSPDVPLFARIRPGRATAQGLDVSGAATADAPSLYRALDVNYPKFFKMDTLCKWAFLGAEMLLRDGEDGWRYDGLDRSKVAVVMHTTDGCLDVDKRYSETLQTVPSPALFVYTLPNIMLGEICIRHGFTGPQLCQVTDGFNAEELLIEATDLVMNRGVSQVLFGFADAVGEHRDVCLFWAGAESLRDLTAARLQAIYEGAE